MLKRVFLLLWMVVLGFVSVQAATIKSNFTISPATNLCADSVFKFKDSSAYNGSSTLTYKWYFGDGGSSTLKEPTHTYSVSGTYKVKLVVKASDATPDSIEKSVTIYPRPKSDWDYTAKFCQNEEFPLINKSTIASGGTIKSYYWDFDNGRSSTQKEPYVTFSDSGIYNVKLITTSDHGCTDTFITPIHVNARPKAAYTKYEHCQDSSFFLDAGTSYPADIITDYIWTFDDNTVYHGKTVTKSLSGSGRHTVKLFTKGKFGCDDSTTFAVTIYDNPAINVTYKNTCVDSIFEFYDNTSTNYGRANSWEWDFGDGTTESYSERKDTLKHIYNDAGNFNVKLTVKTGQGCSTTKTFPVFVRALPKPDFISQKTCLDSAVRFKDISTVNGATVTNWVWYFGDSTNNKPNISMLQNPQHKYDKPGTYDVKLIAISEYGCRDSITKKVKVIPLPKADFNFTNKCKDSTYRFTDISTVDSSTIVAWNWDFGDSTASSNLQNPTHVYTKEGTYNVRLVSWAATGCNDTIVKQVTVYPVPVPDFTFSSDCALDSVYFTDKSTIASGTIYSTKWEFGDGSTGTGTRAFNIYYLPGTYTAKLTVTSDNGCSYSISKTIKINVKPKADFTNSPTCIDRSVQFINNSTIDTPGVIIGYSWNFGDGSPEVGTPNPTHTYTKAGLYYARLKVIAASGCIDTLRKAIEVTSVPKANFFVKNTCVDSAVAFSDSSTISTGVINGWLWDFGDSTTSTQQHPNHKYDSAGTYTVKLVVSSMFGCKDSMIKTITTYPSPTADFSYVTHCADSAVSFTDMSTSPDAVMGWIWDFGDSKTSTDQNPNHIYSLGGTYNVKQIAVSKYGCQDVKIQAITVNPLPIVDFQIIPKCAENPTLFFDNSQPTSDIVSRFWMFGDGDTASGIYPTHVYKDSGTYQVSLIVKTKLGCVDTLVKSVYINPLPIINFIVEGSCVGEQINFTDSSYVPNGFIASYSWDFGDGAVLDGPNPFHTYADTGTYYVKETVKAGGTGCENSRIIAVKIHPLPDANFTYDTACLGTNTIFTDISTIPEGRIVDRLWQFSDGSTSTEPVVAHKMLKSGLNDTVKLTVVSEYGCVTMFKQPIYVLDKPTANFIPTPLKATIVNPYITFENKSINEAKILWKFGDGESSVENLVQHRYEDTGRYEVLLIATNSLGCNDTAKQTVYVLEDFRIYVPNAFSPNGDSFNDSWKPVGLGITKYDVKVYDRWGQMVFESEDFEEYWKGDYRKNGRTVPEGAYKYVIHVVDYAKDEVKTFTGFVNVIK